MLASCALFQGRRDEAGSLVRVPAPEVEALVLQTLREVENVTADSSPATAMLDSEPVGRILDKVVVRKGSLEITYRGSGNTQSHSLVVPLSLPPTRVRGNSPRLMDSRSMKLGRFVQRHEHD